MSDKKHRDIILVGQGSDLLTFYSKVKQANNVVGVFCSDGAILPGGLLRLGGVEDALTYIGQHASLRGVYITMVGVSAALVQDIREACKVRDVKMGMILPLVDELDIKLDRRDVCGCSVLTPEREPLSKLYNRALKRTFDLVIVILLLLTVLPLVYLYKMVRIKMKQRVPSVLTERYFGPDGKVFKRVAFRFDNHSCASLLNVLTGSMSLVGPECYQIDGEAASLEEQQVQPVRLERIYLKPGVTGWAQVKHVAESERLAADLYYVENWSLWLDVKILLRSLL